MLLGDVGHWKPIHDQCIENNIYYDDDDET